MFYDSDDAGLTQRFVDHDRHRIREIEAAHPRLENRDVVGVVEVLRDELAPQTLGLAAEDQEITATILRREIRLLGARGEKFHRGVRMRRHECFPPIVGFQIHQWPIVQSGALEVSILEGIAEWADQMQANPRSGSQARNRAGVLGDFRADEDDIEEGRPNPLTPFPFWEGGMRRRIGFSGELRNVRCSQNSAASACRRFV
jgi:hypothetical protein